MAEAAKERPEDGDVKHKFLSCSICLENFTTPKILPCLHTFCVLCLDCHIQKTSKDGKFFCPCCRSETSVSSDGAAGFKTNFFMNSLVDFFRGKRVVHQCSVCLLEDKTVNAFTKCIDCSDYLCVDCSAVHRKTRLTFKHNIVSLQAVYSHEMSTEIAAKATIPCSEHPDENVRYYCTVCDKTVCRDCKALGHHDHKCVTFQEAIQEQKPIIQEKIQWLEAHHQKVELTVACLEKYRESVLHEQELFVDEVESVHQVILKSLSDLTSQALEEVKTRTEQCLKHNNMTLEDNKTQSLQLLSYKEYLTTAMDKGTDVELLDTCKMSQQHLENLRKDLRNPNCQENLTVRQHASINSRKMNKLLLDYHESVAEIIKPLKRKNKQGVLNMSSTSVPAKLANPIAGSVCTGLALSDNGLIFACCGGNLYRYANNWVDISCEIRKSLGAYDVIMDGDNLIISTSLPSNKCEIVFHNTRTGASKMIDLNFGCFWPGICLNRSGSTIYITDSQCHKVREVNRDGSEVRSLAHATFCYVAQCANGNIFVSKFSGGVALLGPELKPIPNKYESIASPRALQADETGNVYLASERSNAVYMLSQDGSVSETVLSAADGLQEPVSLALTVDNLVVGHKHGVWIYTLE